MSSVFMNEGKKEFTARKLRLLDQAQTDPQISDFQYRLLSYIVSRYLRSPDRTAYPGARRLADELGKKSRHGVEKALNQLVNRGYLTCVKRGGHGRGAGYANEYALGINANGYPHSQCEQPSAFNEDICKRLSASTDEYMQTAIRTNTLKDKEYPITKHSLQNESERVENGNEKNPSPTHHNHSNTHSSDISKNMSLAVLNPQPQLPALRRKSVPVSPNKSVPLTPFQRSVQRGIAMALGLPER